MQDRKLASLPVTPPRRGQMSLLEPVADRQADGPPQPDHHPGPDAHVDAMKLRDVLESWRASLRELDRLPRDAARRVEIETAIAGLKARYQRLFDSVSDAQHAEADGDSND